MSDYEALLMLRKWAVNHRRENGRKPRPARRSRPDWVAIRHMLFSTRPAEDELRRKTSSGGEGET